MKKTPADFSILIVEDEPILSNTLNETLEKEGFITKVVNNGEDGLNTALNSHPDLILLDILMLKMDGLSTLEKLRKDSWGSTVPVIMMTNIEDTKVREYALKYQVAYYFIKAEISLPTISDKIKTILGL